MATKTTSSQKKRVLLPSGDYSVYVDVIFEEGLLYFAIVNSNPFPVFDVNVVLSRKITGIETNSKTGERLVLNDLDVFNKISFLAPGKTIKVFIDSSTSYFKRKQPARIQMVVTSRYPDGKLYRNGIVHDMRIYKNLDYVVG